MIADMSLNHEYPRSWKSGGKGGTEKRANCVGIVFGDDNQSLRLIFVSHSGNLFPGNHPGAL